MSFDIGGCCRRRGFSTIAMDASAQDELFAAVQSRACERNFYDLLATWAEVSGVLLLEKDVRLEFIRTVFPAELHAVVAETVTRLACEAMTD